MIQIEFNDTKISVPDCWQDITLGDYEKWFMQKPDDKLGYIRLVADICKIDTDLLLDSPTPLFEVISQTISFVFDTDVAPSHKVKIDRTEYFISLSDKLTLAEWVDVEAVLDSRSQTKISELLAIVCRPLAEKYNADTIELRKEQFRNLSCDKALPLLSFFLHKKKESETIFNHYSTVREQAALFLKDTKNFVENGAGIKQLPIWQRIRYTCLMKSLEKQLSKFSDFSFTK